MGIVGLPILNYVLINTSDKNLTYENRKQITHTPEKIHNETIDIKSLMKSQKSKNVAVRFLASYEIHNYQVDWQFTSN